MLRVRSGRVDAGQSGLSPSSLDANGELTCRAGQEGRLTLICRDACANQLPSGGQRLAVQLRCLSNGLAQRAAVVDNGDGSYTVRYRPEVACEHEVHAWVLQRKPSHDSSGGGGDHSSGGGIRWSEEEASAAALGGAPYTLRVVPGPLSSGMSGELHTERQAYTFLAGEAGLISLQLRDALGNARPPTGEAFVACLERPRRGGEGGGARFGDELPELSASCHAAAAQRQMAAATTVGAAGAEIAREPPLRASAAAGADHEARHGEAGHAAGLAEAVRAAAVAPVTTLSEAHHPLPTPDVRASDADQRVQVAFQTTRVERLLLHVAVRGLEGDGEVPLRGSPFTVDVVPSATAARRCEAYGDALHEAKLRQPTSFIVLARDAHGNRKTEGGDHFIVSFRGPCNPAGRVYDRGDGTYRVTCTYGVTGHCSMAVMLGQQHIVGSPFRVVVEGPTKTWTPPTTVPATNRTAQMRIDAANSARGASTRPMSPRAGAMSSRY